MPNGYNIPSVEVCESVATSPFIECKKNVENATELYRFLLLKHCADYLNSHYLYSLFTIDLGLNMLEDLEVLTRNTPYIAVINREDITRTGELHVSLVDRVV